MHVPEIISEYRSPLTIAGIEPEMGIMVFNVTVAVQRVLQPYAEFSMQLISVLRPVQCTVDVCIQPQLFDSGLVMRERSEML